MARIPPDAATIEFYVLHFDTAYSCNTKWNSLPNYNSTGMRIISPADSTGQYIRSRLIRVYSHCIMCLGVSFRLFSCLFAPLLNLKHEKTRRGKTRKYMKRYKKAQTLHYKMRKDRVYIDNRLFYLSWNKHRCCNLKSVGRTNQSKVGL